MLVCVRTTINLPDALIAQIKQHASESGRTVTSVLEEALRLLLSQPRRRPARPVRRLPTYGAADSRPLVDLTDRDALWIALEDRR